MRFAVMLGLLFLAVQANAQEMECVSEPVAMGADGEVTITFAPAVDADTLELYLYGSLERTLDDGPYDADVPVEITVDGLTRPQESFFCIVSLDEGVAEDPICCSVIVEADIAAEASDGGNHDLEVDQPPYFGFFSFDQDVVVGDVQVDVDVSLFDIGELTVSLTSNQGTTVVLYDGQGVGQSLDVTFWELGSLQSEFDFDCSCPRFPSGPGRLADMVGEDLVDVASGVGTWVVRIDGGASSGFVDSVALRIYEESPAFPVRGLTCARGEDPATAKVTWTTPVDYDSLEVFVDDGEILTLEGPFAAGEEVEFVTDPVSLPATVLTCVRGVRGNAKGLFLCCFSELALDPVTSPSCISSGGSAARITWVLGAEYDEIEILVDGVLEDTIEGDATEWFLLGPYEPGDVLDIEIVGVLVGVGRSTATRCQALILEERDIEACGEVENIPDNVSLLTEQVVATDLAIEDVDVFLDLATTFVTSWNIVMSSPRATEVTLHDVLNGNDGEFFLVYDDEGIENAPPFECACSMQPTGPGALSDYDREPSGGEWGLTMLSVLSGGTLNAWCIRADGCELSEPVVFECELVGTNASLSWSNGDTYDTIEILRDGIVVDAIDGDEEMYLTDDLDVGRYRFQIRSIADTCEITSDECVVLVGIIDVCETDVVVDAALFEHSIVVDTDFEVGQLDVRFRYIQLIMPDSIVLESPSGTSVQLHDDPALTIGIDLIYDDDGVDNALPWICDGCSMKPTGPGVLADFDGEEALGDWFLELETILPGAAITDLCLLFEDAAGSDGVGSTGFLRGDFNNDGSVSCLVDAVALLNWAYLDGPGPTCPDAADLNDDGMIQGAADALACLAWEFLDGPSPPAPGPTDCDTDPTPDALGCAQAECP